MAKDKDKPAKKKGGKKARKASKLAGQGHDVGGKALDAIERIIDHPIVAEMVAAGAMAALAAVAQSGKLDSKALASKDALKAAGKAAAAAVGARLVQSLDGSAGKAAVKKATKAAASPAKS